MRHDARWNNRMKLAEITGSIGAGVLGAGIGSLLARALRPHLILVLSLGVVLHGWGMWDKHRLERSADEPRLWWHTTLYWICWIALLGLLVFITI